jgi:hypothetical protein
MSDHAIIALVAATLGALGPGLLLLLVSSWQKRQDEQRKETGRRIGGLERDRDIQKGYRMGYAAALKEHRRGNRER